jgi:hypothetical protein
LSNITHPELVAALVKPGNDILAGLTASTTDLWHAATGIAGEGTEICLALLNFAFEGTLDSENLLEELGDMEFYMQQLRENLGITREDVEQTEGEFLFSAQPVEMAGIVAVAAGDVLDFIKKIVIYQKPIDREALLVTLVKLEGPLMAIRHMAGFTLEQVLEANIAKLSVRYAGRTYSDEAAQARADKA